jgi:hypothetical protein
MIIWIKNTDQKERTSSLEEIHSAVKNGILDPNKTYCWYEGLENWVMVSSIIPPPIKKSISEPLVATKTTETANKIDHKNNENQTTATTFNSFRNTTFCRYYIQLCLFLIAYSVVCMLTKNNARPFGIGSDRDIANVLPSIIGIIVYRRYVWDFCYLFKNFTKKSIYLFLLSVYLISPIIITMLYTGFAYVLSDCNVKVAAMGVAICVYGWVLSIDIPVRANNMIKNNLFENGKTYSLSWIIFGSIFLILILVGVITGIAHR